MADSVEEAEMVVALARDRQRVERLAGPRMTAFVVLLLVGVAVYAIVAFLQGHVVPSVLFAVAAVCGLRGLIHRFRWRGGAAAAERSNRAYLERAGRPYQHDAMALAEPALGLVAAGALMLFVYYTVFFGGITRMMDDRPLTFWGILGSGVFFGAFMTIGNLTWARSRNRRAAFGGRGDEARAVDVHRPV